MKTRPIATFCLLSGAVAATVPNASAQTPTSINFESPQARAVALSGDGLRLYALNTPDHRLGVYSLAQAQRPVLLREIQVGMEPVSMAVRTSAEVWVVNHVSDSISVVDTSRGVVIDTIRVGDEPGDVVFAGSPQRAFVTSMTERSVRVIDPVSRQLIKSISVFGDDPRALLASHDGKTIWVAITRSGNKSTLVPHTDAPTPPKPTNPRLPDAPAQGILVHSDDPAWKAKHGVTLPDYDVVEIDVPTQSIRRSYSGVGTIQFHMAQRPNSNELWVANTEARNLVRFEPALNGHAIDSRVTRITTGASPTVTPIDLNPGVDYTKLPNPAALARALSQPTDIVFHRSGTPAYVAAYGTDRIGVIHANGSISVVEIGTTPGTRVAPREKRGPRSLALHPNARVLYVLNRLSNSISVVDTGTNAVIHELPMYDPTPETIREGRGFLYDAKLSGNGTMSCASCHIDGRHDGLAWDLGDPGGDLFSNGLQQLHPMKGPLLTQTLQGMKGERIFHWRADRPGLASFNVAFPKLMGGAPLSPADLATFVSYMKEIPFAPNPRRNDDDTLPTMPSGSSAKDGETIFRTKNDVGRNGTNQFRCNDCHVNQSGTGGFGFDGLIGQPTKAQQLRGLYKRDGKKPAGGRRTAGFGFGADGSKDDLIEFLSSPTRFNPLTPSEKSALQRFLFAFPGDFAPAVGLSRTVMQSNAQRPDVVRDIQLLIAQARIDNCALVVQGLVDGRVQGFHFNTTTMRFGRDQQGLPPLALSDLIAKLSAPGSILTFAGVPNGMGRQRGLDRDLDGVLNGDDGRLLYGAPSPVCAITMKTEANGAPRLGNGEFAITVANAPGNANGWLILSARRANSSLFDLQLLADPSAGILASVQADGRGGVALPLAIPNNSQLVGSNLRVQSVMAAPCGQLTLAASAGLEITVLR